MTKLNDLTGSIFGALKVIGRAPDILSKKGRRQTAWLCSCDCGAHCAIAANNLASGNTRSCGCLKSLPYRRNDLAGHRFGRLVAIEYALTTKRGQAVWRCLCDCGQIAECRATALSRGKVKSCGCYRDEGRFHNGVGPASWAKAVKAGYSCLRCGSTKDLHAHHIIPVSADPSLSRSLFNGECLCAECHKAFHAIYGKDTAGIDDLAQFCGVRREESEVLRTLIYSKGRQDIEKAIHELQLLLELRYPLAPDRADLGDFGQQNMIEPASEIDDDSPRRQAIDQNGNDGLHYGIPGKCSDCQTYHLESVRCPAL